MCECEKIEALTRLREKYQEEAEQCELEHELFGNKYILQIRDEKLRRIKLVDKALAGLTPCADCAYQRARREEEAAKKQRGENWRRVLETVADVAVLKACDAEIAETLQALVKQVGLIEDKYSILETIKEEI